MFKALCVTVKFFNTQKGFGFFSDNHGTDFFVHISQVVTSGFCAADLNEGQSAVIDVEKTERGLVTAQIHSIGTKLAPPTHRRTIVDHHKELVVVKAVEIQTGRSHFEIRQGGITGEQQGDSLFTLSQARAKIGKVLPVIVTESVKTNVPGQGPQKGLSPAVQVHGSGQPKKQKKAA